MSFEGIRSFRLPFRFSFFVSFVEWPIQYPSSPAYTRFRKA
jgi:hypothetical protein